MPSQQVRLEGPATCPHEKIRHKSRFVGAWRCLALRKRFTTEDTEVFEVT